MNIKFLKDCGIRKEGDVLEVSTAQGEQYVVSKFAEVYTGKEDPQDDESISPKILSALKAADVDMYSDELSLASDEEILSIKGIGKSALEEIRSFYPLKEE